MQTQKNFIDRVATPMIVERPQTIGKGKVHNNDNRPKVGSTQKENGTRECTYCQQQRIFKGKVGTDGSLHTLQCVVCNNPPGTKPKPRKI